jgi:hypothetical protein
VADVSEVLILTVDGGGNVPPALALADELGRRGHRVRFLGHPRQAAEIRSHGHGFDPYRHAPLWSGHDHRSSPRAAVDFLQLVTDRRCRKDLAEQLRRQSADVVVIDAMIPEAGVAAGQLGVPHAYLMHTFAQFFLAMSRFEWLARLRGGSMRKAWASAPLSIVAADRCLDPAPAHVPSSFVWAGVAEELPAAPTRA